MLKAVFFDLDGTLLPMDEEAFTKGYFKFLLKKIYPYGYTDSQKFINTLWNGVGAMYHNDGSVNNEKRFWDAFIASYGPDSRKDEPIFDDYYRNDFRQTKELAEPNPLAKDIVSFCHRNVSYTVLSTNPIFPAVGQATRLSFIDLKPEDFDFVSDYVNSRFCKPNPQYFQDLLDRFSLKPEEVIVFGNNTYEDGDCASALGITVYLVKGHIIYSDKAKGKYPEIGMDEIIPTITAEMKARR